MKRLIILICFMVLSICCCCCVGRMATINENWIPGPEPSKELVGNIFRVDETSQRIFIGLASPFLITFSCTGSYFFLAQVDLRRIQETVGRKVLSERYQHLVEKQGNFITSSISDFRWRLPFFYSWFWLDRAVVSFSLNIKGIKNGKVVVSRTFEVKKFKRSGKAIWGEWAADQISKHVARVTVEAVYSIYKDEIEKIVSIISQDDNNNQI